MDFQEFHQQMNSNYYRANCYHTMQNPDNDATSGNHHVINATYHLINFKLNDLYPASLEGKEDYNKEYAFIANTQVEPGLYVRHPVKAKDNQTHDDYIGLLVSSKIFNLGIAKAIHEYGQSRRFLLKNYFDTLKESRFKFDSWFGRFTWFTAVVKVRVGIEPNLLEKISYCAHIMTDVYLNKDRTNTSGRILQWMMNSMMKGKSKIVDACINKWEENIKATYPGQMGEVLGIYHGVNHPFTKAMWGKI